CLQRSDWPHCSF
nr:immunoglobulin light chain junction region [Macaca mulatta]